MGLRVGVAGVGWSGFAPTTQGTSYKELMFEAARRAYADARLDPRSDIDSFVCCSEDVEEGTSIFDEYVPDQLGAVQRPVQTVASDGLFGVATAMMLIRSGVASTVAVESHSKASDVVSLGRVDRFAMDPVLNRPLGVSATALAGLEMRRWLHVSGRSDAECADVAVRNREHARTNPRASYAEVHDPAPLFDPLTREQTAEPADGCVVLVLTSEERTPADAVFIDGIGWSQDAPSVESRVWDRATAAERAARAAYERAGIRPTDVELAEVDDTFAYKQLQHLEALGLEDLAPDRVNRSGGALGEGHLREANGLARALACIQELREGEGGVGLAQSWRGVPSTSAAVAVMRR
ncbi:MAG: thiolase C-terminal domain-containing protein [Actinomycetota bacterium]